MIQVNGAWCEALACGARQPERRTMAVRPRKSGPGSELNQALRLARRSDAPRRSCWLMASRSRFSAVQTVPAEQFPIAGLNRSLLLPLPAAAAHTCPSNPATGYARAPNRYGCSARGDTSRPMNTSRAYQRVRGRRALHDHEQSDYRDKKISHCFLPSSVVVMFHAACHRRATRLW